MAPQLQNSRLPALPRRATGAKAGWALAHLRRFAGDDSGQVVAFTVVILLLMLMIGGIGVDIMQFESVRTQLQQTLDRSTLAAASVTQRRDREEVVRDYFAKADLTDQLDYVRVTSGLNFSQVTAEASSEITPFFMNIYDLHDSTQLRVVVASTAEQRINNVEIVLVLDVSGSMAGSKLTNLKSAASEFVDTVLEQDQENRVSIAIVPYNGQVNLQQYMQEFYTRVDDHNIANVNCFDLPSSAYNSLSLSRTAPMPVTAHADTFSGHNYSNYLSPSNANAQPLDTNVWCPPSTRNVILAPTNNASALKSHINGLEAIGATSINAGMKWGMSLLDPDSRSVISAMVTRGNTPQYFDGRPFDYTDREAMKIVVLMTDGENFAEERINSGYRAGSSPIYLYKGVYSVFHDRANTANDYYIPSTSSWQSTPYGNSSAVRQSWPQIWADLRASYVARQFYARPLSNTSTYAAAQLDRFRTYTEVETMNTQLQSICSMARERNVIVFGIAFDALPDGREQIADCASSPSHYFNAAGLEIRTVFRAIAANISQLKLTQ